MGWEIQTADVRTPCPPVPSAPPPLHSLSRAPTLPGGGVVKIALLVRLASVLPSDLVLHLLRKVPHIISTGGLNVELKHNTKHIQEFITGNISVGFSNWQLPHV